MNPFSSLPRATMLLFSLLFVAFGAAAQTPFITTWKTNNVNYGKTDSTSITIPVDTSLTYNYEVDWNNDGTYEQSGITGSVTHDYGTPGTYTIRIRGTFPRIYFESSSNQYKLLDVNQWGSSAWTTMDSAFYYCQNLNISATDIPDLSGVTSMSSMFYGCDSLNGPANIGTWNTATVTDMSWMFYDADKFNQPIGLWNTANVTTMARMFLSAESFNQTIGDWNTANVTNMQNMFSGAEAFNQSIGDWNTAKVKNMSGMFGGAYAFNQPIGNWITDSVKNMSYLFAGAYAFNQPIANWNTAAVEDMQGMFQGAKAFNYPIGNWNTANVKDMSYMFAYNEAFDQPIGNWVTDSVKNMRSMFQQTKAFNQPIGNWNTAQVTDMYSMFYQSEAFNQPIGNWNTGQVTDMSYIFYQNKVFNQPVGNWNTGNVKYMQYMFYETKAFNQPLNNWNTEKVTNMGNIFQRAAAFNQPLGQWNISSVYSVYFLFEQSAMDCSNYSATLIGWSQNPLTPSNRSIDGQDLEYSKHAVAARNLLINTKSWYFSNDQPSGLDCTLPAQPDEFVTTWKTDHPGTSNSTSITIPTQSGLSYNYDVDWNNDGYFEQKGITGSVAHDFGVADTFTVRIKGVFPSIFFNQSGDRLKLLEVTNWSNIAWTSMAHAFEGCENLQITAADQPNLSGLQDMSYMFGHCTALVGPANIGTWQTSSVTHMVGMFAHAASFNQPLSTWQTGAVTQMDSMFAYAAAFNQPIGAWSLQADCDMAAMLDHSGLDCANYSATIYGWSQNPTTPSNRVLGATGSTYGANVLAARTHLTTTKGWTITGNTASGTGCALPAQPNEFITTWKTDNPGTSSASSIQIPAYSTETYNYEVDWDNDGVFDQTGITGSVTHDFVTAGTYTIRIRGTFPRIYCSNQYDCKKLINISQWGNNVWTSMNSAFQGCSNLQISTTDVPNLSGVTDMAAMFYQCTSLNGPANIGTWNTSNVTTMNYLFDHAAIFNQPVGNWNTAKVTQMTSLFNSAAAFNQPIGNWNTASVTKMDFMFAGATSFNQSLSNWNTAAVTAMQYMFYQATAFNQSLGHWSLNPSCSIHGMLDYSGMDCVQYTGTLLGWAANSNTPSNRYLGASGKQYGTNAVAARNVLINTKGWTIYGDAATGSPCTLPAQTNEFITTWRTNSPTNLNETTITIPTYPGATYNYEVDWNNDGIYDQVGITGNVTHNYGVVGTQTIRIRGVFPRFYADYTGARVQLLDINQWGDNAWTSMERAFEDCDYLQISASDLPNLSDVRDMSNMFRYCDTLNGPANIGSWNTSSVQGMNGVFRGAINFNQPIGTWNTSSVTTMEFMLAYAYDFNQPIGNWDTKNVTSMAFLLVGDSLFNHPIGVWNTGSVQDMQVMLAGCKVFNQSIGNWNTGAVQNMRSMLSTCTAFNQPIGDWNTAQVTNMGSLFYDAILFNQPIGNWNTEQVIDMSNLFYGATLFNQPIGNWNTAKVNNMRTMFANASAFNHFIENWNTSLVNRMDYMFAGASAFNKPIGNWNTANVTKMSNMFQDATAFNQPIGNWNTEKVTDMGGMFYGALAFNQPIGNWNTANVFSFNSMFAKATAFNQPLGTWVLYQYSSLSDMLDSCGLDCANYSATLNGWGINAATPNYKSLGAKGLKYGTNVVANRDSLITSKNWIIVGDEVNAAACTPSIQPSEFITTWETVAGNTTITIPTHSGSTYNYQVDWDNDGIYDKANLTGDITHDFGSAGTHTVRIRGTFPRIYFNNAAGASKLININQWGHNPWTSMGNAFRGCSKLQITATDVPKLSGVKDMSLMFFNCTVLNSPTNIGTWATDSVTNMNYMFQGAEAFNQPIGTWNTAAVTNFGYMFNGATSFNKPLSTWNTGSAVFMNGMFYLNTAFNQPIGNWDVSNATYLNEMFYGATSFNQSLADWTFDSTANLIQMLNNSGLDCVNYGATLNGWSANPATPSNRSFGALGRTYGSDGTTARTNLTTTKGWTISGDALVPTKFFADTDGDGFGNLAISQNGCTAPTGFVADSTDCNDADITIKPTATEITADGIDQNCDGIEVCYKDADNDGFRPDGTATVNSTDADCADAYEAISTDPTTDCNDNDATIYQAATEIPSDGIDQSCDGQETCYQDADNDGFRPNGTATVNSTDIDCADAFEAIGTDPITDCNDNNAAIKPGATELTADGVDQNCNGQETCYTDADNDGFRPNGTATVNSTDADCADAYEAIGTDPTTDCNDNNVAINPLATEICNGLNIDENCDGITEATTACTTPSIVSAAVVVGKNATFNWSLGCNVRYRLQYKRTTTATWTLLLLPNTAATKTVTNLPNGTYQWQLRSQCYSSVNWSPIANGTNFVIAAPALLQAQQNETPTSMAVSADPINHQIISQIKHTGSSTGLLRLIDAMGRVVHTEQVNIQNDIKQAISTTGLATGIYYLQLVVGGEGVISQPVLVAE
jgi:surface protein